MYFNATSVLVNYVIYAQWPRKITLKIPKDYSEAVNRRRTYNAKAKRKMTKGEKTKTVKL